MAVLDHLLDEDAFDGLVAGAYVASAESMEGEDGDDQSDRYNRGGGFRGHAKVPGEEAES